MRSVLRAILVSIPSVFLGTTTLSSAQVAPGGGATVSKASRTGDSSAAKTPAVSQERSGPRDSVPSGQAKESDGNDAQVAQQTPSKSKPTTGGGYTWSEKKNESESAQCAFVAQARSSTALGSSSQLRNASRWLERRYFKPIANRRDFAAKPEDEKEIEPENCYIFDKASPNRRSQQHEPAHY
jgi:hypothetical protein